MLSTMQLYCSSALSCNTKQTHIEDMISRDTMTGLQFSSDRRIPRVTDGLSHINMGSGRRVIDEVWYGSHAVTALDALTCGAGGTMVTVERYCSAKKIYF